MELKKQKYVLKSQLDSMSEIAAKTYLQGCAISAITSMTDEIIKHADIKMSTEGDYYVIDYSVHVGEYIDTSSNLLILSNNPLNDISRSLVNLNEPITNEWLDSFVWKSKTIEDNTGYIDFYITDFHTNNIAIIFDSNDNTFNIGFFKDLDNFEFIRFNFIESEIPERIDYGINRDD